LEIFQRRAPLQDRATLATLFSKVGSNFVMNDVFS